MQIKMNNGKVTIDGKTFQGSNVSINGRGKVVVDGITQDGELVGDINVVVHGDVNVIENTNGSVKCQDAQSVRTTNGKVSVGGDIRGDVKTTNGDVSASSILGKVSTVNGDIN